MKGVLLKEPEKMEVAELETPILETGHALIKMKACGICGSDLTAYRGTNPTVKYPVNGIGHEGVGVIDKIGEEDKNKYRLKEGDRVVLEPYIPCESCYSCKESRYNNCVHLQVAGVHTNGVMCEVCSFPLNKLYKIPDTLSYRRAALVEPLTIGLHGLTRARVKAGEYCVITGAGPIGLMAAFGAISYGATPILVDVLEQRLEFARQVGIPYVYNNSDGKLVDYLEKLTNGKLPEAMVECTGSPAILGQMHEFVCHGGRIAMVGWPMNPVTINTIRCMQKELDLCPSRNSNNKFDEAIKLINEGKVPVDQITTKVIRMEETKDTIIDMIEHPQEYLKVVVEI